MAQIPSLLRTANLACRLGRHRKPAAIVWHEGWSVGNCPNCGTEVCRPSMGGRWDVVSEGYRIVWQEPSEELRGFRRAAGLWDGASEEIAVPMIMPIPAGVPAPIPADRPIARRAATPARAASAPEVRDPEPAALHPAAAILPPPEPLQLDVGQIEAAIAQAVPTRPPVAHRRHDEDRPEDPAQADWLASLRKAPPAPRAGLKERASVRHELRVTARASFRRASPGPIWRAA